jgi:hypothetical protein
MTVRTTKQLRLRRGNTAEHSNFVGAPGEITIDTDLNTIRVHNGSKLGGHLLATNDYVNTAIASIPNITGPAGPRGDRGEQGLQGPAGRDGVDGAPGQSFLNIDGGTPASVYGGIAPIEAGGVQ